MCNRPLITESILDDLREKEFLAIQEFNNVWFSLLSKYEQAKLLPVLTDMIREIKNSARGQQELKPWSFIGQGLGELEPKKEYTA